MIENTWQKQSSYSKGDFAKTVVFMAIWVSKFLAFSNRKGQQDLEQTVSEYLNSLEAKADIRRKAGYRRLLQPSVAAAISIDRTSPSL